MKHPTVSNDNRTKGPNFGATGRNAILIEREPDYGDIIAKRCGIAADGSEKVPA